MTQVINTNINSLKAQSALNKSQSSLSTALERLSSGMRINSAKDDAAGLAISQRMSAQVRGLNQAIRNANDGISLTQTAESALGEVGNILQRMRELSIQAANATNSDSDRVSLQQEVSQLKAELQRIAENTTFNGQKVLNGAMQNIQFQVGAEANQTIGISIGDARSSTIGSQLVVNNNTSNGLQRATYYNRYATEGADVGKIQAIAASINAGGAIANGYTAQTLTLRDAQGNIVQGGEIGVQANEEASTVAARLNGLSGVRAEAYTSLRLSTWVGTGTDTVTVSLRSGSAEQSFTLSGVDSGDNQEDIFAAVKNVINGSSDLLSAGVVAGTDAAGNLVIRNNTGADIAIDFASASAATVDAYGSDTANTSVTLDASGNGATSVGGQINIFLANGYTVESSVAGTDAAGGLLDANASATAVAKETGVGIADVRTHESRSNLVITTGDDVGKAQSSTVIEANGYLAQTIKIKDASGTTISGGSISISAAAEAKTIASQLNAISGVSATASSEITLNSFTGTDAGTDAYNALVTLNNVSGTTDVTLTVAISAGGEATQTTSLVNLEALRDAINANTTLSENGFAASMDASGNLKITSNDGQDIALQVSQAAGTGAATITGFGADKAGTTFSVVSTGASDSFVTAGGKLEISLANGYTIESSVDGATAGNGGLLDAGANVAATAQTTNVAYGNAVAAQTLTINGNAAATVSVAKDDSAETIAQKINTESSTTGVKAEARTQLKLSDISAVGTVSFTLYGDNSAGVDISGVVSGSAGSLADMSALASAINAKSDQTGIFASLTDNNAAIILEHKTGADIVIADFSHSAGSTPNSSNISGTAASLKVSGRYESVDGSTGAINTGTASATTLYYGGVGNAGADSTVVGGTVSFRSSTTFDVRSSVAGATASLVGGNSSLFGADASVANTASLSSVNGVNVSTVSGANNAVSVIDYALTQINNVRGALGAVQNRFESTISSLTAASQNISAARSRILDADFAEETANLTRSQILQQASVAMLSQANQLPQLVLSLLK